MQLNPVSNSSSIAVTFFGNYLRVRRQLYCRWWKAELQLQNKSYNQSMEYPKFHLKYSAEEAGTWTFPYLLRDVVYSGTGVLINP